MTQKEIAGILGISEATVSLALRNNEKINIQTRERVKQLAALSGYCPNFAAQALALGKTHCVGVITKDTADVFFAEIVQEIHSQIRGKGYIALCLPATALGISQVVDTLLYRRVDGIICMSMDVPESEIAKIRNSRMPVVYYDYPSFEADTVMINMHETGKMLTQHLIDEGCRRIAFLGKTHPKERRYCGYRDALSANGIPFFEELAVECPGNYPDAYAATKELLSGKQIPDGFVCFNDVRAIAALRAVLDMGFSVPGDVAVAGIDNIQSSAFASVPLTTADLSRNEIVSALIDMLFLKIGSDTEKTLDIRVIEPQIIVRASSLRKNPR